jgi:hypothetical protein
MLTPGLSVRNAVLESKGNSLNKK